MEELLLEIRSKNYNLQYLLNKVETFYETSKDLKDTIEPMLLEAIIKCSDYHKEMVEIGEMSPSSRYYYKVGMELKEFKRLLVNENFSKDEKELHIFYISLASEIFEMERTKYLYQAYSRILQDALALLPYDYNQKPSYSNTKN